MDNSLIANYLRYEPDTGNIYWIADTNDRGPSKVGRLAGALNSFAHRQIRLWKKNYYGHQIAWFLTHGYIPKNIDHKNGNPSDNRLCNLREATHARNIAAAHSKACGYEIHGRKYRARIDVDEVRHELGSFDTPEEATAAYQAARQKFLGEFA